MPWREVFAKQIFIRIADDECGFVYSVKCGGITFQHGFASALDEHDGEAGKVSVRLEAAKNHERDPRHDDAP
jgi:hypothetical protein